MSYDMCVYYKDGTNSSQPIAGFFTFDKFWLKPRKALKLQHIPDMANSLTIRRKRDVELIIKEFEKLKEYHLKRGFNATQMEGTRIDEMLELLQSLIDDWERIDHVNF